MSEVYNEGYKTSFRLTGDIKNILMKQNGIRFCPKIRHFQKSVSYFVTYI